MAFRMMSTGVFLPLISEESKSLKVLSMVFMIIFICLITIMMIYQVFTILGRLRQLLFYRLNMFTITDVMMET